MPKNTTTYIVKDAAGEIVVAGITKKAKAIEAAVAGKKATRKTHTVETSTGNVVHTEKGVRAMKSTPRYSRTVELPEGFELPEGARPAYLRKRHDAVIVAFDGEEGTTYSVYRLSSQELEAEGFELTREAGAHVLTMSKPEPVAVEA